MVIEAVPSVEMVRFVSSGTEATMSAIRLARGFTKRDVIIKFAGCYHGHVDSLLVSAGSCARPDSRRSKQPRRSPGLHRRHARARCYNDVTRASRRLFEARRRNRSQA